MSRLEHSPDPDMDHLSSAISHDTLHAISHDTSHDTLHDTSHRARNKLPLRTAVWNSRFFLLGVLLCLLLLFLHALNAGHYCQFYPINGTFQNFNPIRRLLSGQIPYRDFQDYLGLGHLYVGSIFTVLFGGNFRASLIAFSFLTLACFSLLSFVTAYAVFKRKESAIAVTNLVLVLLLVQPLFFSNVLVGTTEIRDALNQALDTGTSARFVRGLILPLSCGLLLLGKKLLASRLFSTRNWIYAALTGVVAGVSFVWSNDFGISCWLCLAVMTFWYTLSLKRKLLPALQYTGVELLFSLAALILTVELCTLGHLGEWIRATFGTGGYQHWYYNSDKSYYIWDLETSFVMLFQAGLCLYYLAKIWGSRERSGSIPIKYGILAYENMASFCAAQEYKLLSGGYSRAIALSVLFLTVLFESMDFCLRGQLKSRGRHVILSLSTIASLACIVSGAKDEFVFAHLTEKEGTYVEALGGNNTTLGADLLKTDEFLNGDSFFSTYASAQEVVSGIFQPSGTDYIIHVLGDSQRERYLDAFHEENFRYAVTINETLTDWEYWVQRANWFLYRELYAEWHPVFANSYEVYWEKNTAEESSTRNDSFQIQVEYLDDATAKLIILCDSAVNGIADVYIDYEVCSNGTLTSRFNFQRLLTVRNTGACCASNPKVYECNNLREKSAEYIPIPVANGYGEVTLTANPSQSVSLNLKEFRCDTIFTTSSRYVEIKGIREEEGGSVLLVQNTEKNRNALQSRTSLIYGETEYLILEVRQEGDFICIKVDGQPTMMQRNIIQLA